MRLRRRTKVAYQRLFDSKEHLFEGVKTTLWPNGEPEIWFQTKDGRGFRLKVSEGAAGLGMTVNRFAGGAPITTTGNLTPDGEVAEQRDQSEVTLCQYKGDARSQVFKKWYGGKGPHPDMDVRLFLATGNGWHSEDCANVEAAHGILREVALKYTHWAIAPIEQCDGGVTPPPRATIHELAERKADAEAK